MDYLNKIKNYCAKREVCISEATKKLLKIGLDKDETKKIVELLVKQKYIDEKRYAFAYVNDHYKLKKWGRNKIKNSLKLKGITSQNIRKFFVRNQALKNYIVFCSIFFSKESFILHISICYSISNHCD